MTAIAKLVALLTGCMFVCQSGLSAESPAPANVFKGKIAPTLDASVPDWPTRATAPAGAPNVVLILLDDVGFGAAATFGGPATTPELDRLAANGLSYNRFHTAGLCSPTRAALLTGRNHHQVGFGNLSEAARGFPGYNAAWGKDFASVADVLRRNGYNTAAFGKWHNTPPWENSPAGPFDRWPNGLGFEYFYGFMHGETSQWEPLLYRNNQPVDPPATPSQGYHLTADLVDDAIRWLHRRDAVAPDKPYFIYFATGATHAPHHVPQEWIRKYQGKFDQGWDKLREEIFARQKQLGVIPSDAKLTARPAAIPAWDSLDAETRKLLARQMEVYAGYLSHTDHEIGRLLQAVQLGPHADNTLVLYIVGDNGGSAEGGLNGSDNELAGLFGEGSDVETMLSKMDKLGGPDFNNNYAVGWPWATSTPFQWMKQVASHFGGTRNPLVVSWPAKISSASGIRGQFHHVVDIAPTIYEAAGVRFPASVDGVAQKPLDGVSMLYSFNHPDAADTHKIQYFEMIANRALYKDGWVAAARHGLPWEIFKTNQDWQSDTWELYHVDSDFSEAEDVAGKYPKKLRELRREFDREASRNHVFPISTSIVGAMLDKTKPSMTAGRHSFVYYLGANHLPDAASPDLRARQHRITAQIHVPDNGAEGVIVAKGGRAGGFSLYVRDGRLVYENNFFAKTREVLTSSVRVPTGDSTVAFEFTPDNKKYFAGGKGQLFINGVASGEMRLSAAGPFSVIESFDVGEDDGSPVSQSYDSPFKFTGLLQKVIVDLE